jgi:hypothetical protein
MRTVTYGWPPLPVAELPVRDELKKSPWGLALREAVSRSWMDSAR